MRIWRICTSVLWSIQSQNRTICFILLLLFFPSFIFIHFPKTEMKNKNPWGTTTGYYYTTTRISKIKKADTTKYWQRYEATRILIHCWWKYKTVQPPWEKVWQFLIKLNTHLHYDPSIPIPREIKTFPNDLYNVHSSFIHIPNWKQLSINRMGKKNKTTNKKLWYT